MKTKPTAADFAKYYGCKCRYRVMYHQKWNYAKVNSTLLHFLEPDDIECQLVGRGLSSITEDEVKAVTEVATGKKGWKVFRKEEGRLFLSMNDGDKHRVFAVYFEWHFTYSENYMTGFSIPNLAAMIDTLRSMGFVKEEYFENGWAVTEEEL